MLYAFNPFGIVEFISSCSQNVYKFLYDYFIAENTSNHEKFENDPSYEKGDVEFLIGEEANNGDNNSASLVNFLA